MQLPPDAQARMEMLSKLHRRSKAKKSGAGVRTGGSQGEGKSSQPQANRS